VKARKEVILSAGVFNTPQILMLSGIGDKEALEQLDISSVVHSPCVGKGMSDHAYFASSYISKTKDSHFTWLEAGNVARYVNEWKQKGTGPLTSSIGNHMGYFRLPESNPVLQQYSDPSSGKTSGHFEMLFIVRLPSSARSFINDDM
jgi:choline dehydrogenase-like flavoprotein